MLQERAGLTSFHKDVSYTRVPHCLSKGLRAETSLRQCDHKKLFFGISVSETSLLVALELAQFAVRVISS